MTSNRPAPARGRIWPWAVGALLGATVLKYAIVLSLVATDPSIAVEDDYYRKAIAWDETRAAQVRSDALGWSAHVAIGPDRLGRGEARIELFERHGEPIRDAVVTAVIFPQARATDRWEGTLARGEDGVHRAALPTTRRGLWRVELEATRGEERFIDVRTVDGGCR